jgi:ribosomal protein S18 acetylase RimI-like enzyme
MRLTARGPWPGVITLRQGWASAEARPWNDDLPYASLRLVRGGARFLAAAADHLLASFCEAVLSAPTLPSGTHTWRRAGFDDHLELDLYRHELDEDIQSPDHVIRFPTPPPWPAIAAVDRLAFDVLWRMGELGLREAYQAVSSSTVMTIEDPDGALSGFAIVGTGTSVGYLQRIAVDPASRGRGYGRSLLRASLEWIRARGGQTVLLNTQPDNAAAAALYRAEHFYRTGETLRVLRRLPE